MRVETGFNRRGRAGANSQRIAAIVVLIALILQPVQRCIDVGFSTCNRQYGTTVAGAIEEGNTGGASQGQRAIAYRQYHSNRRIVGTTVINTDCSAAR